MKHIIIKRGRFLSALALLLIIFQLSALLTFAEPNLNPSNWAKDEVLKAESLKIIPGAVKGKMQANIDRKNFTFVAVMALKNLYRINLPVVEQKFFDNVHKTSPYYSVISAAKHYDIVSMPTNKNFDMDSPINKKDAVVMLSRMNKFFLKPIEEADYSQSTKDFMKSDEYKNLPDYAKKPVCDFIHLGFLKGNPDGSYKLDDNISTEVAVVLTYRYMTYINSIENQVLSKEVLSVINSMKDAEEKRPILSDKETFKVYANISSSEPTVAVLSDMNYFNALNSLNNIRHAAGMPPVVTDKIFNDYASKGALLLYYTNQFSHYPEKKNAPQSLFTDGSKGTAFSNIGKGYSSMAQFNFSSALDDDEENKANVGHRRWLINPNLQKTGFGMAGEYALTYVVDESRPNSIHPEALAYPCSPAFPLDYLKNAPMSIQFGLEKNGFKPKYYIKDGTIPKLTLTRLNDGKVTVFEEIKIGSKNENYLYNISRTNNGYGPAIVFRPEYQVKVLDRYKVKIEGLTESATNKAAIYEYEFILF